MPEEALDLRDRGGRSPSLAQSFQRGRAGLRDLQEERVVEVATEQKIIDWFGPRGLASIVFGLLVIEQGVPQGETLPATVATTVAAIVLLHGLTSAPLVTAHHRWYASHLEALQRGQDVERKRFGRARCGRVRFRDSARRKLRLRRRRL